MKYKIFLLLVAISIVSCNKKSDLKVAVSNTDTLNQAISDEEEEGETEGVTLQQLEFPKTGKNAEDFVLEPCEIKMKAEGFLDDDTLKDFVIVLQNKNDNTDSRATLVLLKQKTGGYKLQEISWEAVDPEYTDGGYRIYDNEEIFIDNEKTLHIMLQAMGPPGTRETVYRYVNNDLVLVKIGTFNSGAGSQLSSEYNLVSGQVDHEVFNTMQDDSVPGKHQIKKFNLKRQMLFVSDNPNDVLKDLPGSDDW